MGIIAGGMVDGQINVWNPSDIVRGGEGLISCLHHHQGAIQGLHFNPHKESSSLLASGGNDGEVYIISLEDPSNPVVFAPADSNTARHTADVTKVAWNTQVAHILATSSQNGSCFIWDLKQKKAWCELRDPAGGSISDIAWNPEQGLNIVTASGDDRNPVIKLYDLRSSTSLPLATLQGHSQGILSLSWCPNDPSLLMSCGKDNRTILWDLFHAKPVYDLPYGDGTAGSDTHFGGIGNAAGQRKYHVSWSPCLPAVIGTCSFDRTVQFYSLSGVKSSIGRPPKWLRRPIGASFGFGGKLVCHTVRGGDSKKSQSKLTVFQTAEDYSLVAESDKFHEAIANNDFSSLCDDKARTATDPQDQAEWALMKILCFEPNTRENLITHLGFDKSTIEASSREFASSAAPSESDLKGLANSLSSSNLRDFDEALSNSVRRGSLRQTLTANETAAVEAQFAIEREAEPMIRSALVVGNFAAAVDCCLEAGLMAEALLLSQCGDASLWEKTQKAFFERQKRIHRLPFLDMLQAIIRNELRSFVAQSALYKWRETLALLSTYAKTDEFPAMCELLGSRLESEANDVSAAKLCYMCAMNYGKVITLWVNDLRVSKGSHGAVENSALWKFITKIVVFTQNSPNIDLGVECAEYFSMYAHILASHGRLDTAPRYIRGDNLSEAVLRDRVYHASYRPVGPRAPAFPFTKVVVNAQGVTSSPQSNTVPSNVYSRQPSTGSITHVPSSDVARGSSMGVTVPVRSREASYEAANAFTATRNTWEANPTSQVGVAVQPQPVPQVSAQQPVGPTLPAGWVQLVDPGSGRPYYVNQALGISQWELPTPPAQPIVSPVPAVSATQQMPSALAPQAQQPATSQQSISAASVNVSFAQTANAMASSAASSQVAPRTVQQPTAPVTDAASSSSCEAVLALHQIVAVLEGKCV